MKAESSLLHVLVQMGNRTESGRDMGQILLTATKDMKVWRAMIAYVLKGDST